MTTSANVLSFYAQAKWGSRWGVTDAFHTSPHKGLDVGLFHGIVDVPTLHSGTVVAVGSNSLVGHYVTIKRADNLFDTYCHIVPGVKVGDKVAQGSRLGRQAVTQQEGGLQWQGQHTHLCLSRTQGGWGTWPTLDPTPGVIAVLTNTAGDGGQPIHQEDDMITRRLVRQTNTPGVYAAVNNVLSPIISPQHLADTIADWKGLQAVGDPFLVQAGPGAFNVIEVADLRTAGILPSTSADITTGGGTTDLAPVLAAITALAKQESDDQAALLFAISQVDESTLTTFGLKRI